MASVNHYGHDTPHYQLLLRRWKSQYICGLGELLRAAIGQPHLPLALAGLHELPIYLGILAWAVLLLLCLLLPLSTAAQLVLFLSLAIAPFALMYARKRSISKAVYSVVSWLFNGLGLMRGFLRNQLPPQTPIASLNIAELPEQGS
jgi:hypothetical protein